MPTAADASSTPSAAAASLTPSAAAASSTPSAAAAAVKICMNLTWKCIQSLFEEKRPSKAKPLDPWKGKYRPNCKSRLLADESPDYSQPSNRVEIGDYVPFCVITNTKSRLNHDEDDYPYLEDDDDLPEDCMKMSTKFKFNPPSVIQAIIFILIVAALTVVNDAVKKNYFSEWGVMGSVLIFGRLVSGWAIRVMVYSIFGGSGNSLFMRKRVLYFVYRLRNALQNCVWLGMVLVVWEYYYCTSTNCFFYNKTTRKIFMCLLAGKLIWVMKDVLVKAFASSFYASEFLDRVLDSLLDQYVIETLSGPATEDNSSPGDQKNNDDIGHYITRLINNHTYISSWTMKRLMRIVRNGLHSALDEEGLTGQMVRITSVNQAKNIALEIFKNVSKPISPYMYHEHLARFFGEDEALMTMRLLEYGNSNRTKPKSIYSLDFQNWVVNALNERRTLVCSLNDAKTVINKVDQMLNVVMGVVVAVVTWLSISEAAPINLFVILSFLSLLVLFIFGNTCKITFGAILFFFATHPFDAGDVVQVDGNLMIVERVNILTTVFLSYEKGEKMYYPNSELSKKPIKNYRRSPLMKKVVVRKEK